MQLSTFTHSFICIVQGVVGWQANRPSPVAFREARKLLLRLPTYCVAMPPPAHSPLTRPS